VQLAGGPYAASSPSNGSPSSARQTPRSVPRRLLGHVAGQHPEAAHPAVGHEPLGGDAQGRLGRVHRPHREIKSLRLLPDLLGRERSVAEDGEDDFAGAVERGTAAGLGQGKLLVERVRRSEPGQPEAGAIGLQAVAQRCRPGGEIVLDVDQEAFAAVLRVGQAARACRLIKAWKSGRGSNSAFHGLFPASLRFRQFILNGASKRVSYQGQRAQLGPRSLWLAFDLSDLAIQGDDRILVLGGDCRAELVINR